MSSNTQQKIHPVVPRILWTHPSPTTTQMYQFQAYLESQLNQRFPTWHDMYTYSVTNRSAFWRHLFQYLPMVYSGTVPDIVVDESARMDSIPRWFHGVRMNFAESILFSGEPKTGKRSTRGKEDDKIAVDEVREGGFVDAIRQVTFGQLRAQTALLADAMRARGVEKGDRVAIVASNSVDTLTCFLAVTSLGGIFSSSSTDMGVKGILDRLTQIRPRYVFIDDISVYNGKRSDLREKIQAVVAGMRDVSEFYGVVVQPRYPKKEVDLSGMQKCEHLYSSFLQAADPKAKLKFTQVEFSDPFLIVYSSGTTGQPKCIVHSTGGVILNGHKEARLHRCVDENSRQLQYTTTGWIMYLAAVQVLFTGARMIMYDGSPFVPSLTDFVKLLGDRKVTHLGTSPRYLHTLQSNGIRPREVTDLANLEVVTSTGMVLSDALFEWFYDQGFPARAQLDNISGGTDLAGSFGTGNPLLPVYVGGCQSKSLGTPVKVYDQTSEGGWGVKGVEVEDGVPGELVADAAFPTMPVMFWGENGAQRYFDSYFGRFDDVWVHGDFILIHPVTKNVMFLGRADGVLNPSGVRFGSAEIYSIVDAHFGDVIADSICVGQRRPNDEDEKVMLFLLMKPGQKFTKALVQEVKNAIRKETSPRHVPSHIFQTPEIPTTVNLKKVELPVKQIVSGKIITPSGTLLNPDSLDYYYQFAKVEELVDKPKAKL